MAEETGSVLQPEGDRSQQRKNARDNLLHAGEFTRVENTAGIGFLRGWIPEKFRQTDEIIKASDDVWALTVLKEHFLSELNSDPTTRTRESRAVLANRQDRAGSSTETWFIKQTMDTKTYGIIVWITTAVISLTAIATAVAITLVHFGVIK